MLCDDGVLVFPLVTVLAHLEISTQLDKLTKKQTFAFSFRSRCHTTLLTLQHSKFPFSKFSSLFFVMTSVRILLPLSPFTQLEACWCTYLYIYCLISNVSRRYPSIAYKAVCTMIEKRSSDCRFPHPDQAVKALVWLRCVS